MSNEDQEKVIGRISVARSEARRALGAAEAELDRIKKVLMPLLATLPNVNAEKFHYEISAVTGSGIDLSPLEKLLQDREALQHKIADYTTQLKNMGIE